MPFPKGTSGNPAGRKPGQTAAAQIRQAIEPHADAIIAALLANALAGDTSAAKALLDRICPALRPEPETVEADGDDKREVVIVVRGPNGETHRYGESTQATE